MKRAFLATVVDVERKHSDSFVVRLECDALTKGSELISTGLNGEQSHERGESSVKVICQRNPKAEVGDKVPVIIDLPK